MNPGICDLKHALFMEEHGEKLRLQSIYREKQLDIFYRTGRPIYTMTLETQHIKSCNNPYAYVDKEGYNHLLTTTEKTNVKEK